MAKFVLTDASVNLDANDLSDHVESLTINYGAETPEQTAMSDITRRRLPGLIDWTVDVTFRSDFAAANLDSIIFPLVGGIAVVLIIKPTSAAVSSSNPTFTGNVLVATYNPLAGTVGDTSNSTVVLTGDGTLVRAEV